MKNKKSHDISKKNIVLHFYRDIRTNVDSIFNSMISFFFSENEDKQYTELKEENEKYNTYEEMHNYSN